MCLERFVRCKDRKQITGDRTIENRGTVSKSDPLALELIGVVIAISSMTPHDEEV